MSRSRTTRLDPQLVVGTFVDSRVLLDIFTEDETWLSWSETALREALASGPIVINAVVMAEISPRFSRIEALKQALPRRLVVEEIPDAAAFLAGHAHANYRRAGGERSQILPNRDRRGAGACRVKMQGVAAVTPCST